jgi:hypothetical protein
MARRRSVDPTLAIQTADEIPTVIEAESKFLFRLLLTPPPVGRDRSAVSLL